MASSTSKHNPSRTTTRTVQRAPSTDPFKAWTLEHFKVDTLQKARAAVLVTEGELALAKKEATTQAGIIKGLQMENSQLSAQLLKLASLTTRRGELRTDRQERINLEEITRPAYEQRLLVTLQQTMGVSPVTLNKITEMPDREQRLIEIATTLDQAATRIVNENRRLQEELNTELESVVVNMEKHREIDRLNAEMQTLHESIDARDKRIRELQCLEQESAIRHSALHQQFVALQEKNRTLVDCVSAMQTQNNELITASEELKEKIVALESEKRIDSAASQELLALSVGLGDSLSLSTMHTESVQADLEMLTAETQVSMVRLDRSAGTMAYSSIGYQDMGTSALPDPAPSASEQQLMESLKCIWTYILEPGATISGAYALVKDEIQASMSDIMLTDSSLQVVAREMAPTFDRDSLLTETKDETRDKNVSRKLRHREHQDTSTQTDASLSHVAKVLANEKRLRDKISLLENASKGQLEKIQSLEEQLKAYRGKPSLLDCFEQRLKTPTKSPSYEHRIGTPVKLPAKELISMQCTEVQTSDRLIIEAPDPSWPDFNERMEVFETTLNNLYTAIQQQKACAGADLRLEDLASTIRTQIIEAMSSTAVMPVIGIGAGAGNNLDLSIITDDITDYDRSLLHLQKKKSEQRVEARSIFPFWK